MAASPAVRNLEALSGNSSTMPQPQRQSQVVRTPLHAAQTGVGGRSMRRRITPVSGFALGVLGHAIEYLADEYVHEAGSIPLVTADEPRMQAIQLLMAANREVYYSCPLMPSLGQRLRQRLLGRG